MPTPTVDRQGILAKIRRRPWPSVVAAALLVAAVFGIGIYRLGWRGGTTRIVARVLPYPAAIVEGRVIRYADFQQDLDVLTDFYEAQKREAPVGSLFPTETELRARVLDRMVKDELAHLLAQRYGIAVSSEDVREAYDGTILDQTSLGTSSGKARAEARAQRTLDELYGLSPSQFKTRVLQPFLLRQRLEEALRADDALNADKRAKADEALKLVRGGKDFGEVALAFSEDPSVASTKGERGFVGRGLLPPEVEAAAFALAPGGVSEVVRSALGFHVVQTLAFEGGREEPARARIQEIFIRPIGLDEYLEVQRKTASVILFVH